MKIHAPKSHPRYLSNLYRDILSEGVNAGITSLQGLTAHGRGEAFDYLLGEKTRTFALKSIRAAAAMLLTARLPVLSVNGNTAALIPQEMVNLGLLVGAPLEINLFHSSKERERKIRSYLKKFGARNILLPDNANIDFIESNRRMVNSRGQLKADVIFIPLEDGDRTEALIRMNKKVITVDLNPLSRTAQKSSITIVDNVTRCLPLLIKQVTLFKKKNISEIHKIESSYSNKITLSESLNFISERLLSLSQKIYQPV